MMGASIIFLLAYLIGSISSAILVCRILQVGDPRDGGSGNPGATNVLRLAGKKAAALTLVGDMLKGLLPVVVAQAFFDTPLITSGTLLFAVLGHMYPVWFGFKGGKGVATLIGGLMGLSLLVAVLWGIIFGSVFAAKRIVSLASLSATALLPILGALVVSWWHFIPLAGVAALVIWRHRDNIERLRRGEEKSIDLGKML